MITEEQIKEFVAPGYEEQFRKSLETLEKEKSKHPKDKGLIDCYGELRWIPKDQFFKPAPGALEGPNPDRIKLFSKPPKEYRGFKDEDKDLEEVDKLLEDLIKKGIL